MGDYTFSEFKSQLKFELGERTDLESHTDLSNLYGRWINTAYLTLTTKHKFWGLKRDFYFPPLHTDDASQSTTDGVAYVDVPGDSLYVEGIWDRTNDTVLENIGWKQYKGYTGRADTDAEGEPTEWARRGSSLYLYKTPDDAYALTIYYVKKIDKLDGTTYITTELGEEWDEPILKLAVIQSLQRLKRYKEARDEKEEWVDMVSGLINIYAREERDRDALLSADSSWMSSNQDAYK